MGIQNLESVFSLGVVVAFPAAALRAPRPVRMQQGLVGIAAVRAALPGTTPIGAHD